MDGISFFFSAENRQRWYTPTAASAVLSVQSSAVRASRAHQTLTGRRASNMSAAKRLQRRRLLYDDRRQHSETIIGTAVFSSSYCDSTCTAISTSYFLSFVLNFLLLQTLWSEYADFERRKNYFWYCHIYLIATVFGIATMQIAVLRARSFADDNSKPVSCTLDQIIYTSIYTMNFYNFHLLLFSHIIIKSIFYRVVAFTVCTYYTVLP